MAKRSRGDSFSTHTDSLSDSDQAAPSPPADSSRSPKYIQLDKEGTELPNGRGVMRCSLPPHKETISFASHEEYEVHNAQVHVNRCSECGKNFPTAHFLGLHIEENHDPLNEARKERGEKIYGCFVEGCERKCSTLQKRRMHLIDKHMFPRTYNFFVVNDGIDRRSSMLRSGNTHRRRLSTLSHNQNEGRQRRRNFSHTMTAEAVAQISNDKSTANKAETSNDKDEDTESTDSDDPQPVQSHTLSTGDGKEKWPALQARTSAPQSIDDPVADLANSMSALRFVPTSVTLSQLKKKGPAP